VKFPQHLFAASAHVSKNETWGTRHPLTWATRLPTHVSKSKTWGNQDCLGPLDRILAMFEQQRSPYLQLSLTIVRLVTWMSPVSGGPFFSVASAAFDSFFSFSADSALRVPVTVTL
jgi:hypothetical protein